MTDQQLADAIRQRWPELFTKLGEGLPYRDVGIRITELLEANPAWTPQPGDLVQWDEPDGRQITGTIIGPDPDEPESYWVKPTTGGVGYYWRVATKHELRPAHQE